ncbi:hypothetical protein [Alicyclobacillus herbarius]|uniref:hypothetical protein n=1 Tax=Alicyclobacillus herbarius TaxID=122960 RepID=UPI000405D2E2|nr:hypothetical protein [Alicyclobacillus herbarius]
MDESLPVLTRRQRQEQLRRKRKRQRRRRRRRRLRLQTLRALRTTRFWINVGFVSLVFAVLAFWARFAYVYHVPAEAQTGILSHVTAYITLKPWWFGPPTFDLARYAQVPDTTVQAANRLDLLLSNLGPFQAIVEHPDLVWVWYSDGSSGPA